MRGLGPVVLMLMLLGTSIGVAMSQEDGAEALAAHPAPDEDAPAVVEADAPGCIPSCVIEARETGFRTPVTYVESGATVVWRAADNLYHTAWSGPARDVVANKCLEMGIFVGLDGTVRFDIIDGQLVAQPYPSYLDENGDPLYAAQVCEEAVEVGPGEFALTYHCDVHQNLQKAVLIVHAA